MKRKFKKGDKVKIHKRLRDIGIDNKFRKYEGIIKSYDGKDEGSSLEWYFLKEKGFKDYTFREDKLRLIKK